MYVCTFVTRPKKDWNQNSFSQKQDGVSGPSSSGELLACRYWRGLARNNVRECPTSRRAMWTINSFTAMSTLQEGPQLCHPTALDHPSQQLATWSWVLYSWCTQYTVPELGLNKIWRLERLPLLKWRIVTPSSPKLHHDTHQLCHPPELRRTPTIESSGLKKISVASSFTQFTCGRQMFYILSLKQCFVFWLEHLWQADASVLYFVCVLTFVSNFWLLDEGAKPECSANVLLKQPLFDKHR